MSDKNDELRRLKRIRDQQIRARDPSVKQKKLQHTIATKRRKSVRKLSFLEILREVSHKIKGTLIGGIIGLLIFLFLPYFVETSWIDLVGIGAIFFLSILGFFLGQALDARDSLKELINK
jgi:VIT1/CCC1 family predicted Fe2+/Mn2+ transporter